MCHWEALSSRKPNDRVRVFVLLSHRVQQAATLDIGSSIGRPDGTLA